MAFAMREVRAVCGCGAESGADSHSAACKGDPRGVQPCTMPCCRRPLLPSRGLNSPGPHTRSSARRRRLRRLRRWRRRATIRAAAAAATTIWERCRACWMRRAPGQWGSLSIPLAVAEHRGKGRAGGRCWHRTRRWAEARPPSLLRPSTAATLAQLRRSLASEREARLAAYQDRSLVQARPCLSGRLGRRWAAARMRGRAEWGPTRGQPGTAGPSLTAAHSTPANCHPDPALSRLSWKPSSAALPTSWRRRRCAALGAGQPQGAGGGASHGCCCCCC